MKKATWLLSGLFIANLAFSQSNKNHTVKIKESNNSSKNIEVEVVYKKKPTEVEQVPVDKARFLMKRKSKNVDKRGIVTKEEKVAKSFDTNSIFTFDEVDRVPIFFNCKVNGKRDSKKCFELGISKFIQQNFEYPEEAIEDGITGKVTIKFTVNKDGELVNVVATDSNDIDTLTSYSVALMSKFPKLKPAQKEGKPVATSYEFQLDFSL